MGAIGTELLRYTTQAASPPRPCWNTEHGKNAPRYPSAEMQARFSLGWAYDAFNSTLSVNYQHPTSGTFSSYPYNLCRRPVPIVSSCRARKARPSRTSGGTVHTPGFVEFNLAMNYALSDGMFGLPGMVTNGTSVSLNIDNILDNNPPFSPTSANGYANGDPLGRVFTIGLKKNSKSTPLSLAPQKARGFFFILRGNSALEGPAGKNQQSAPGIVQTGRAKHARTAGRIYIANAK